MAQWLTSLTRNHEIVRSIPRLASGLRIQRCRELWCRLQMRLRSCVAVALAKAGGTAPIRPLAWEPPYAACVAPEKTKKYIYNKIK